MRKLIIILGMMLIAFASTAQRNINKTVTVSNYAYLYNTDITLRGNDTILNYAINFQTANKYHYEIAIALDSIASTSSASVQLQGKIWDTDSYSNIGSAIAWAGTSTDTVIKFSEQSTLQTNQYLRLVIDGDSCTVDYIKERIYK